MSRNVLDHKCASLLEYLIAHRLAQVSHSRVVVALLSRLRRVGQMPEIPGDLGRRHALGMAVQPQGFTNQDRLGHYCRLFFDDLGW